MYFMALATDYDGTLAQGGVVDEAAAHALERLKETGRRLILVTGRELPDLKAVCPDLKLFDRVVAENGALVYTPASGEERVIAGRPPALFVERLRERAVQPLSVGRAIVATREPNQTIVLEAIRDLGLELQIIFNKGAVMVLPAGVNKASGLHAALEDLELSAHNVVAIGDAENDHAFLHACGCSVAVANALATVKAEVDLVTEGDHGAGVLELVERLIADDLASLSSAALRRRIPIGVDAAGGTVELRPQRGGVLIAGASGGGKSTLATALLERLVEREFQFCIFDPEGDYAELEDAIVLGDASAPPRISEVLDLLRRPKANVVVNLLAFDVADRPDFFAGLLPELAALRARTGRPHWILIDEAHHMLPAARGTVPLTLPKELPATILVTVHPEAVSRDALATVDAVLAIGGTAPDALTSFFQATGDAPPPIAGAPQEKGEALMWSRESGEVRLIRAADPHQARRRHTRKYAQGDLGEDKSFHFRGPRDALNLRAQNLTLFMQIADGVDEETWLHHLRAGDYSDWFRNAIKDDALADEAAAVERDGTLDADESRRRIREAVERRYTAPAAADD